MKIMLINYNIKKQNLTPSFKYPLSIASKIRELDT